ncbi:hypothetical protein KCU96_g3081, partial [Aureobasidium melanogenum]
MEELQQRHRKEAKDLQSKITQKKKAATKKTRKGVNDECDNLERDMKARHQEEIQAMTAPIDGEADDNDADKDQDELADRTEALEIAPQKTQPEPTSSAPPDPPTAPAPKKQNRAKAR